MNKEDLAKRDYVVAIDRSTSMLDPIKKGSTQTRWQGAKELTHGIARECAQWDDDGITVILFAGNHQVFENITDGVDKVDEIFDHNQPNGSTNTAGVLKFIFDDYRQRKAKTHGEAKPMTVVLVTDGEPDDEKAVQNEIVNFTRTLDNEDEFGIEFLQIGDSQHARDFLKRLDEGLEKLGAKFDIVNTKNLAEMDNCTLTDMLLDAVNQ